MRRGAFVDFLFVVVVFRGKIENRVKSLLPCCVFVYDCVGQVET